MTSACDRAPREIDASALAFLATPGEMADAVRRHDWASTPLGPPEHWPQSLKTVVGLMLATSQPMFLAWSPAKIWFYNDAFTPILGRKHPGALGRSAVEVWPEVEAIQAPLFEKVFQGAAVQMDDLLMTVNRGPEPEEAHFSFSYAPVRDERGTVAGLLGICSETTEKLRGEKRRREAEIALELSAAAVRASAERVSLALDAGAIVGTWIWQVGEERFRADEQFARSFGLDVEACGAGLPLDVVVETIHADDFPLVARAVEDGLKHGGPYRCEYRVRRADGHYRWIEASGRVELNDAGRPQRFLGVLTDIHSHRQTEQALRRANDLLRTFMEAVPGVIFAKDREGRLLLGNRGMGEMLERSEAEFVGMTDAELLENAAEAAAVMASDRRVMESGEAEALDESVTYRGGRKVIWHSVKAPLRDETGAVIGLVGASLDITERRDAERHRELLVNELNHRVKNTLAIVQSTARQTLRRRDVPDDVGATFEARLVALAAAHDLLTRRNWDTARLHELVETALAPFSAAAPGRLHHAGPELSIPAKTAVSFALAIHELATNAAKYGALSNGEGQVGIFWTLLHRDDGVRLRFTWRERNGPRVAPPTSRGFGSRLIERALAAELGGEASLVFHADGVVCSIDAPLSHLETFHASPLDLPRR
jgi:PAS domain S-box-containing protein